MAEVFKVIGRTKHPNWSGISKAIEQTMAGPVKRQLPEYAVDAVSDWDHKIPFPAAVNRSLGDIRVQSYPTGPNAQLWIWVVQGTAAHIIRPKNARVLAFPSQYVPHTKPSGQVHGSGRSSKKTRFAMEVHHPGTRPRPLIRRWVKQVKAWFRALLQDAVRQGVRRA